MTDAKRPAPAATPNGVLPASQTAPPPAGVPEFRFSTDQFSERHRLAAWRDIFGRTIINVDFELAGDHPVNMEATVRSLPGLGVVTSEMKNLGYVARRTREHVSNGTDDIIFTIMNKGVSGVSQLGRDVTVSADEGFAVASAEVGHVTILSESAFLALRIPRPALAPMVPGLDAACLRPITKDSEPLRLLRHYLAVLQDASTVWSPELQRVFVSHTYDLVAAALGTTREAAEIADGRGLQAARLRAIKDDVLANLHSAGLTVTAVALRNRMTPRHVQRLFDEDGVTFSQFVREQRLAQARRMLTSHRFSDHTITTIAYTVGFSDLSHFNHAFRRHYGMTPSDMRAAARRDNGR
jgi:AraC-like DNA-binding protein